MLVDGNTFHAYSIVKGSASLGRTGRERRVRSRSALFFISWKGMGWLEEGEKGLT